MRKPSPTTIRIVETMLRLHPEPFTGYQVLVRSGVKSGSVYPTLHRLVRIGWIIREVQPSTVKNRRPISHYRWANPGCRYYAARVVYDSTNGIVRGRGNPW
jgi:Transcriptional regulator PadR-like family